VTTLAYPQSMHLWPECEGCDRLKPCVVATRAWGAETNQCFACRNGLAYCPLDDCDACRSAIENGDMEEVA